jgi:hypothetical protein
MGALQSHHLLSSEALATLLSGNDARALAPYGLPLPASDTLVHFGSCTANPITPSVLGRHLAMQACPPAWRLEAWLRAWSGAARCQLIASGTDAEYSLALAMGATPFVNVLMDPSEVGSGCARAAAGLPHASGGPVQAPLPLSVTIETTRLRDDAGVPLSQDEVDQQVLRILSRHQSTPVLLHHVACSKTGLSAPSEAACLHAQLTHAGGARVVVDASQGRCQPADVQRWLAYGWAVIITGSKYFGAPPFCGAVLWPSGWPEVPGLGVSPGLVARWQLAIQAMQRAQAVQTLQGAPCTSRPLTASRADWGNALRTHFLPLLDGIWIDDAAAGAAGPMASATSLCAAAELPARQGILSFDLGLDATHTRLFHRALIADGFFIGQPVQAGPRSLLRVALGALTPMAQVECNLVRLGRTIQHELVYG